MTEPVESLNPETGQRIRSFASTSPAEVQQAVARARAAQPAWAFLPFEERAERIGAFAREVARNAPSLTALIKEETGKRIPDAQYEVWDHLPVSIGGSGGIDACIRDMQLLIERGANRDVSDLLPHGMPGTSAHVRWLPHGVVGMIMPWNFPLWIPIVNIIPALLAGNTVVFKPSEYATLVGLEIDHMLRSAGVEPSVFQTLIGGKATGQALANAGLDQLWLTGSLNAGMSVQSAMRMRPVEMELGGNSAAIICEDADLDLAIAGSVWGATYNAGQSCSGIKRIFVHHKIADAFVERAVESVRSLRAGTDYGPLIRASQRDHALHRIHDARAQGAQVLIGGSIPSDLPDAWQSGFWLAPTVMVLPHMNIELVREETFANVMPIFVVQDEDEAVRLANDTAFGLSNSVWSRDTLRAHQIATRLHSGMVFINEVEVALLYGEHWRGWKDSSIAGAGSKLERCFKQQLIVEYRDSTPREYWYPYPNE
ncbi:MAG: aldehyde dehydrogenase family protein [Chloroflexota bacterium]|nr:aldehyde dehydrogenase family protein [Chloroflexota bacterium]